MDKSSKSVVPAYLAAVFKAIIYGTTVIFVGKLLETTDVFDVLALRFLTSACAFLLLQAFGIIKVNFKGKSLKLLAATALFEPVLYFTFETYGIKNTTVIMAGILTALAPFFTVALETIFLKEKTNAKQRLFLLVRILGVVLITVFAQNSGESSIAGIIFMLLAVISGSAFVVCSRGTSQNFTSTEITYFSALSGAVVFNAINIVRHLSTGTITSYFVPLMNIDNVIGIIFLGVCSSIMATGLNNYALSKVQASIISALSGLATVTTIITGVLFNNEVLYWYHIAGTILILIGIIGMSYASSKKRLR